MLVTGRDGCLGRTNENVLEGWETREVQMREEEVAQAVWTNGPSKDPEPRSLPFIIFPRGTGISNKKFHHWTASTIILGILQYPLVSVRNKNTILSIKNRF